MKDLKKLSRFCSSYGFLFCLGFLGTLIAAKPGYYLLRKQVLDVRAKYLWNDFKDSNKDPQSGDPVLWIKAPQAGLSTMVVLQATEHNLRRFPALEQLETDDYYNQLEVVFGHRDAHFSKLAAVQVGDSLTVEGLKEKQTFRVLQKEIFPKQHLADRLALGLGHEDAMVLVTCFPFRYVGPAPKRCLIWLVPEDSQSKTSGTYREYQVFEEQQLSNGKHI